MDIIEIIKDWELREAIDKFRIEILEEEDQSVLEKRVKIFQERAKVIERTIKAAKESIEVKEAEIKQEQRTKRLATTQILKQKGVSLDIISESFKIPIERIQAL